MSKRGSELGRKGTVTISTVYHNGQESIESCRNPLTKDAISVPQVTTNGIEMENKLIASTVEGAQGITIQRPNGVRRMSDGLSVSCPNPTADSSTSDPDINNNNNTNGTSDIGDRPKLPSGSQTRHNSIRQSGAASEIESRITVIDKDSLRRLKVAGGNIYNLSRDLLTTYDREKAIVNVLLSEMMSNWEDFYYNHVESNFKIDAFQIKYSSLQAQVRVWTRVRVLHWTWALVIINFICFVGAIASSSPPIALCGLYEATLQFQLESAVVLVVPIALALAQASFVEIWKRNVSKSNRMGYRQILSLKIHYLSNLYASGSTTLLLNAVPSDIYKVIITAHWVLLSVGWALVLMSDFLPIGTHDDSVTGCYELFSYTRLLYVPAFAAIGISGSSCYVFVMILSLTARTNYRLITTFMDRYICLQRLRAEDLTAYIIKYKIKVSGPEELAEIIRRDAYERYLLVNHLISETSVAWQFPIGALMISSLIITALLIAVAFIGDILPAPLVLVLIILSISGFLLPAAFINYSNTAVDVVKSRFQFCVPPHRNTSIHLLSSLREREETGDATEALLGDPLVSAEEAADANLKLVRSNSSSQLRPTSRADFELIGGRDEWLEFLKENPIYWTIFGFAITPQVLSTLGITAVTSLGAAILSVLSYSGSSNSSRSSASY